MGSYQTQEHMFYYTLTPVRKLSNLKQGILFGSEHISATISLVMDMHRQSR